MPTTTNQAAEAVPLKQAGEDWSENVSLKNEKELLSAASSAPSLQVQFDIIGDVYVDLLCYLPPSPTPHLALNGSDSTLRQPITLMAGGSTLNTATYLQYLQEHGAKLLTHLLQQQSWLKGVDYRLRYYDITVHSMFNPEDHYGSILLQHAAQWSIHLRNGFDGSDATTILAADTTSSNKLLQDRSSSLSTPHCIVLISSSHSSSALSHPTIERTFLTHRGCASQMTIQHLFPERDFDITVNSDPPSSAARHVHIAGFFCTPGYWIPPPTSSIA